MALQLRRVAASQGAAWVRRAFGVFARRPLALMSLFASVMLFAVIAQLVIPMLSWFVLMLLPPLLSLGYMIATRSALAGGPVHPGQLIEPLRKGEPARRRNIALLCLLYALPAAGLLLGAQAIDGGRLAELQTLMQVEQTEAVRERMQVLMDDPQLLDAFWLVSIGAAALSVPFWHAPALVYWGGQGIAQALFSSVLACWRTKGAFLVYGATWVGLMILFALLAGLAAAVLGLPQAPLAASFGAGLVFTSVFYVSLYFCFDDSFAEVA